MGGRADGPASGRLLHGYKAHRDAGVPFQAERPVYRQNDDLRTMAAIKEVKALCTANPQYRIWAAQHSQRLGAVKLLARLKKKMRQAQGDC